MMRSIPVIDFSDYTSGDLQRQQTFIQAVGDSLKEIGFFALKNHEIPLKAIEQAYEQGDAFFSLRQVTKNAYLQPQIDHQRGYTAFGIEHAKNNPAPDLKEFWQSGRSHPTTGEKPTYVANVWPEQDVPEFKPVIEGLFARMEAVSQSLLHSCSLYLGKEENWLSQWQQMAIPSCESFTILHLVKKYLKVQSVQQPMKISISSPYWLLRQQMVLK
tara:strand:- start:218 stop:862 length:645 start_codon:yes stop_codon:yes gene_type:complete